MLSQIFLPLAQINTTFHTKILKLYLIYFYHWWYDFPGKEWHKIPWLFHSGKTLLIVAFNHNIWHITNISSSSRILSRANSQWAYITLMHFSYSHCMVWLHPGHACFTNDWSLTAFFKNNIILRCLQLQKYTVSPTYEKQGFFLSKWLLSEHFQSNLMKNFIWFKKKLSEQYTILPPLCVNKIKA